MKMMPAGARTFSLSVVFSELDAGNEVDWLVGMLHNSRWTRIKKMRFIFFQKDLQQRILEAIA